MPLVAEKLAFGYRKGRPVLSEVSFEALPGAVSVVLGPNGAGKSTLLRLLLGVLSPWSGRALLDGEPVHRLPAAARARRIAYVAQRASVAFDFDSGDVVRFGLFASPRGRADRAADRLGVADLLSSPFAALSAGQQQRIMLARALAQIDSADGTRVLLADEPFSAMDPRHALIAADALRSAARDGAAVVLVLHDLGAALRFADRAILLDERGNIAAHGPAADVIRPERLDPVYGVAFTEAHADGRPAAIIPLAPSNSTPIASPVASPAAR